MVSRALLLLYGVACAASPRAGSDQVIGTWRGRAVFREAPLEFAVRFFSDGDSLRATFSSPDLMLLDQPLDSVRRDGSRISFSTRDDNPLHFRGALTGDVIRGSADVPAVPGVMESRRGADATPLSFEMDRVVAPSVAPYATRAIRFDNGVCTSPGRSCCPLPQPVGACLE